MQLIRFADLAETPWKNGGGTTTEIAVSPEGAGFDSFDWRLSVARVASDGPFSIFPQIDRTLTLIEGKGMRLAIDGGESVELTTSSSPLAFPGDVPVAAWLVDGPIRDLNVMTRRGRYRHQVQRVSGETMVASAAVTLVVALGEARLGDIQLGYCDTAQVEGPSAVPLIGNALVIGLLRLG
jgi:environmental stress-induced protein Ves